MLKRLLPLTALSLPGFAVLLFLVRPTGSGAQEKTAATKAPSAAELAFYEKEVRPLLEANCFKCHGSKRTRGGVSFVSRGGLSLLSRASLLKGGDTGPAVSLDRPEASLLLKAIHYQGGLEMPPSGKLSARQIATLTHWVKAGAPMPGSTGEVAVAPAHKGMQVTAADRTYWAYRPMQRPAVPKVKNGAWVRNPIDAFILARVEAKGLAPAPPADRTALIRRVYYDLTGLPPTPEEIDAFVRDLAPDAYERLVDRLLRSPHYGEKWARHWLDIVRYAETNGFERDNPKPFAWRYRDYVIDAFNQDKPYDLFVREQLAGDLLDDGTPEALIATGYYRLGQWDDEPADRLQAKYDVLDGIVSTTAQAFLGMSVGCARCHDHKRDPIPQKDYYRLLAFFHNVTDMNGRNTRRLQSAADRLAQAKLQREQQAREAAWAQEAYRLEQRFAVALAEKKGIRVNELPVSDLVGLSYRFYRDTWEKLPDFDALKVETSGPIAHNYITLAPAWRTEAIGFVFEGKLKVPQAGTYTFILASTDGARLILDGKTVLDRPGKGRQSATATATLSAGLVPLRLEYFNTNERPRLKLDWSGPGVPRRPLTEPAQAGASGPESVLLPSSRLSAQTWAYTFDRQVVGWQHPDFDAKDWKTGKGGFGTFGTPGAVIRTVWAAPDIWLRRKFQVDALPQHLALDLHHDDDVQVYLNGTLIYQAKGYTVKYGRVQLGPQAVKALRRGTNVLAVHCRQYGGGQYIDVGLLTGTEAPDIATLIRQHGAEVLGAAEVRQYQNLVTRAQCARKLKPVETGLEVMCVAQTGPVPTQVLIRGNPGAKGDPVVPGFPEVLSDPQAKNPPIPAEKARLALADWLTDPRNPLPARVLANRLWQYHFGRGIVPSPNDFGRLGESPTHPELLDWLASELVAGGWKLKRMHKLILTSNAYRMSAKANDKALRVDPANTLFWRFNMRRLTAEEVRDSMLAVSGRLNLEMGGPSVYPPIPKEVLAGQSVPGAGWKTSPPEEAVRRSVYVHVKRSLQVPILAHFDQADTDSSCPVRFTTTVPTQALSVLNGEFSNEQAALFARRLRKETPDNLEGQVRRAIRLTTGRVPTAEEIRVDVAFVRQLQEQRRLAEAEALRFYCLMMLNANEFVYLD